MIEVLTVLETEQDYLRYRDAVVKNCSDRDLKKVLDMVDRFYRYKVGTEIDWSTFATWFFVQNPSIVDDKKVLFEGIFTKAASASGSRIATDILDTYLSRHYAERIAFQSMEVAEGKKNDLTGVQIEFDDYMVASGQANRVETQFVTEELEELLEDFTGLNAGLTWRLNAFNESLGPLRISNIALFAGRPESGKTTLMCSEATHMAQQLTGDQKVLYFSNEEAGKRVKARLYSSALGVDVPTLLNDPPTAVAQYEMLMGGDKDRIMVMHKADLHIKDIEYWLNHHDVALICIDQLRKVRGFEEDDGYKRLERLFQHARGWSDEYAPVMTVGQLDGQADNEQYPPMSRLYESKTGVQGEVDVIVNIGQISGTPQPNTRWLNIVKNKLPTPGDPSLRHGKHEVLIMPDIGRYVG